MRRNHLGRLWVGGLFILALHACGGGETSGAPDAPADVAAAPDAVDAVQLADTTPFEDALADTPSAPDLAPEMDFGSADWVPEVDTSQGPECLPGEGCFLDPCADNADCLSGWCVEHLGDDVCTQTCVEECPTGFDCVKLAGTEPDVVFACVSPWPRLCLPCTANQDCKTAETIGGLCVQVGDTPEFFCGAHCAASADCPGGYECRETTTIDGKYATQCVPLTEECTCTDKAVANGLYTACQATNEWGTCEGFRQCDEAGLTPCDAPEPSAETCDGEDNDCDGTVDEETCDDDNPCTDDVCAGADGCVHTPVEGQECTDGDLCTTGDHCEAGACLGNPVVCDDGNPCTDDYCGESGQCLAEPNHELCDDSNPCTLADVCNEGACIGTPIQCDCQTDADCAPLDDDNVCNGALYCDKTGLPYKCKVDPETVVTCDLPPDADPFCQKASCAPETGECLVLPANEGFACNDSSACTVGEKCSQGVCGGGVAFPCDDKNPCTMDSCNPDSGCVFINAGGECDDGDPCTVGDTCADGACQPGPMTDCDDSNPCTADTCDPDTGCVHTPTPAPCDDANPCTVDDHCTGGICLPGGLADCDDSNPCTTDKCQSDVGCVHTLNNLPCNDGNQCTVTDVCQAGQCVGSGELACDDANGCTDDACDPDKGCTFTPNDAGCSDSNLCTTGDHCANGACIPDGFLTCDDANVCTDDTCDPDSGCQHTPNQAPCDDGVACTHSDSCAGGQCQGQLYSCDDQVDCTDDVCNGEGGCFHPVANGTCYIAGDCWQAGDKQPGNVCYQCAPGKANQKWTATTGGVCAQPPGGTATCVDGVCTLTDCDEGFDDCDSNLETGCEVHLPTDPFHCGTCDNACTPPESCNDGECSFECPEGLTNCDNACKDLLTDPLNCNACGHVCLASGPELLTTCDGGECAEGPCPEHHFNLDLHPANGCEYECALTAGGAEICDGLDNDCDDLVDEDFDLPSDPANCGACGNACGPYQHVQTVVCQEGDCAIGECAEGYQDADGVVLNGCEEMIATGQLWVDAWNFFDPDEDGSQSHPFDTIAEALAVAEDGTLIHVLEGTYAGGLSITLPNVVLQGQSADTVFVLGPQYGTGILVQADNVTVRDMTVQGAGYGIRLTGVNGGLVRDCSVTSIAGNTNTDAAAIFIHNSVGVQVQDTHVQGVTGGQGNSGCGPGSGNLGAGILLDGATGTTLTNCLIEAVVGGRGGSATCCTTGGKAGIGAGIFVRSNSNNHAITGSRIHDVVGGRGGNGQCGYNSAHGNIGTGIYQHTGGGLIVENDVIYDIRGGRRADNSSDAYSACLYGHSVGAVLITGLTCVGSGDPKQRGIWADPSTQGLYGVTNSIIADLTDYCLYSHSNNFPSTLMASYSDLWNCAAGATYNAQAAGNSISQDPLFLDAAGHDYHLQSTSPCIDSGKTTSEYCNEPAPNGCRANMGAYTNTDQAAAKDGADHCACD